MTIWNDGNEKFVRKPFDRPRSFRIFSPFQLELRDENQRYRAYLEQRKIDEQRQQAELDRVVQAELDKQNAKRAEKARAEQEKRTKLLHEVVQGRQEQLAIKSRRERRLDSPLIDRIEVRKRLKRPMIISGRRTT